MVNDDKLCGIVTDEETRSSTERRRRANVPGGRQHVHKLKVSPEEGKALLKDFKSFIGLQLSYYIPDVDHQPGRRKAG